MGILKTDRKKEMEGHKLVGAIFPPWLHEYMTLYTLAKGTTKSKLLKTTMEGWMSSQRAAEADDILIKEIVERLNVQRSIDKANRTGISFMSYKEAIRAELISKGLKKTYVTLILSGLIP